MTILYNCHHDGDQYRITKFTDGNPSSSYLCTESECECPAGERPTCRHRQMLPQMIRSNIINTPWFLDWDASGGITDFDGNSIPTTMREPTPPAILTPAPFVRRI